MNRVYSFVLRALYPANPLSDHSNGEKHRLCNKVDREEKFLQEDRMRSLQETEQLKKLRCTEADRAKQLRTDELSTQEKERKSAENPLIVQNQELQDNVTYLNDAREVYDPETASSSGLSHASSQPTEYSESSWND